MAPKCNEPKIANIPHCELHLNCNSRSMDSSVIHQSNGKLGMYLNIPVQCASIYDDFIEQLQRCKDGQGNGDENITHGCLVQVTLNSQQNACIFNDNGSVKRYDLPTAAPEVMEFVEQVRTSGRRPSRKEIVQFLLDLLEETDIIPE